MKKIIFLVIVNVAYLSLKSQTCITLQPDGTAGQDAVISSFFPTGNFGNYTELNAVAWTSGGNPSNLRGLIKFDLSSIPANAVITSAKISLYAVTTTPLNGNLVDPMSGDNASYLQRVTADWSPTTVTWNNQPTATTANQVTLATSTSVNQNYTNVDVTLLIQDMRTNGNYGFLLRAINETAFRSMTFASSNHSNAAIRPKLEVCYNIVASTSRNELNKFQVSVWPNPVTENHLQIELSLQKPEKISIQMFELNGRVLSETRFYSGITGKNLFLHPVDLLPGVYLVRINIGKETMTNKVIVQKR
jgi:hypothetical protein